MFEVISRQKFSSGFSTSRVFREAGGFIGRSDECEWVLPDKGRRVSRKHAVVSCDGKAFFIEDISSNGITVDPGRTPLAKGVLHKVAHGDCYAIGTYIIQARLLYRPDAYIEPAATASWEMPSGSVLSPDPLKAMEQQEHLEACRRLGYYDDLVGETAPARQGHPADHSSPAADSLEPVVMIPDIGSDLPEDWDREDGAEDVPLEPVSSKAGMGVAEASEGCAGLPGRDFSAAPETEAFFKALGFSSAPASSEERARMLLQAAEVIVAAVDGLHRCLRNQAECKNELRLPVTTMRLTGNNPFKFTPTSRGALGHLLGARQDGMMPGAQAVIAGFDDLHGHHMGLLAGARASVRAVLEKISPAAVESRLDLDGSVRLSRKSQLWHLFRKMHQALLDDHDSFAAFFLYDFARAYELQARTLRPLPGESLPKGGA